MRVVAVSGGRRLGSGVWTDEWIDAIRGVAEFTFVDDDGTLTEDDVAAMYRAHDVVIVGWTERAVPESLAADPGALRYVCSYAGSIRGSVPRVLVEAGMLVSNWGDLSAAGVAEGSMTLLLASAHLLPLAFEAQRSGAWGVDTTLRTGLEDLAVGVFGCGVVGTRFVEMLRPFGARIRIFDPYAATLPDGAERADTLDDLCTWSEALVIHAGLSEATEGALGAPQLARLRDGAIVVNTARGAIVNQDALVAELLTGRLRAALDVLEPDLTLAADHPLRHLENVIITFHQVCGGGWPPRPGLRPMQQRVVEQLERFARGETPRFTFDLERYDRST